MAAKMERTDVPGVFRRGSRYVYSYRHRGKQRWGTAATKADAKRAKRNAETDIERGEHRDASPVRFADHARRWIDAYQGRTNRGFKEKTRTAYRAALENYAIPYFELERGIKLAEIEPRDIKDFIAWLAKQPNPKRAGAKLSRSTIKRKLAPVAAMFADAVEDGVVRSNPTSGVRVVVTTANQERKQPRPLTREQLAVFLRCAPSEWRTFFEMLAHTGLRISEAIELRWARDVKFGDRPRIEVRWQFDGDEVTAPKSEYGKRTIPLSQGMARQLWRAQSAAGGLVFTSSTGTRIDPSNLRKNVLAPTARAAGVPWAGFHSFRHTNASLLFAAGKNVKQVQEWLGHHDAAFTLRTYVHLMDDGLGDADFLDDVVVSAEPTRSADREDEPLTGDAAEV